MTAISIPMILFFLFTSLVLINSVEAALNEVWQVFEPRPIVQRVGIFCTIILAAPLLLVSALLFFRQSLQPYLGGVLLGSYISSVTPFLIMFAVFGFLFYVIPKAPVKFGAALFGAFLTGILFIATYWGFA